MTIHDATEVAYKNGCEAGKRDAVADILSPTDATKWIPVTEPPKVWRDENGTLVNYLVYMPEYGVDIGNYMLPAGCWVCMGIPCKVTHWMPLPPAPKEDA